MEKVKILTVLNRKKTATAEKPGKVELLIWLGGGVKKYVATDISLFPGQWDEEHRIVINHDHGREINRKLYDAVKECENLIADMVRRGRVVSPVTIAAEIKAMRDERKSDFYEFAVSEMDKRGIRDSTRRAHFIALDALRDSGCVKSIDDLTPENIAAFDRWLRKTGPHREQTTLHNYHKRIKPYINEAVRQGLLDESPYTRFKDVRGKAKERRPLLDYELERLEALNLTDRNLQRARDLFVFSCYTGLSHADVELFDPVRQIVGKGDRLFIEGNRVKTGSHYFTPLLPPARRILERYGGNLPMFCNQTYNRLLRMLGQIAGISKPLTSHIARHTFATTVALSNDIPIELVSRMLGHTDTETTKIYAKVLDTSVEKHAEKLFKRME